MPSREEKREYDRLRYLRLREEKIAYSRAYRAAGKVDYKAEYAKRQLYHWEYKQSPVGREVIWRARHSPKGLERAFKYKQTPYYAEARHRNYMKRRHAVT